MQLLVKAFAEDAHPREASGAGGGQYKPGEFVPKGRSGDGGQDALADKFGMKVELPTTAEPGAVPFHLEHAARGFDDLGAVLGLSPAEVGLSGGLTLRLGDNMSEADRKAEFSPEDRSLTIGLKHGAGNLGHEWWHALDNALARNRFGAKGDHWYLSENLPEGPLGDAMEGVLDSIHGSLFGEYAKSLDAGKKEPYWSLDSELTARAFEAYLEHRLTTEGRENPYLVNTAAEGEETQAQNYPTEDDDTGPIFAAFDRLLSVVRNEHRDLLKAMMSLPLLVPLAKGRLGRKPAPGQGSLDFDEESHPRAAAGGHDGKYKPGEFVPKEHPGGVGGEAWELLPDEYAATAPTSGMGKLLEASHRGRVLGRLVEGKSVAQRVLDYYPGIQDEAMRLRQNQEEERASLLPPPASAKPVGEMTLGELRSRQAELTAFLMQPKARRAEAASMVRMVQAEQARLNARETELEQQARQPPGQKKPYWQKPLSELLARPGLKRGAARELVMHEHRQAVEQALQKGDPVPAEVLADYPDLGNPKEDEANERLLAVKRQVEDVGHRMEALKTGRTAEQVKAEHERAAVEQKVRLRADHEKRQKENPARRAALMEEYDEIKGHVSALRQLRTHGQLTEADWEEKVAPYHRRMKEIENLLPYVGALKVDKGPRLLVKAARRKPTSGQGSLDFEAEAHPRQAKGAADDRYKPGEFVPKSSGPTFPRGFEEWARTGPHLPVEIAELGDFATGEYANGTVFVGSKSADFLKQHKRYGVSAFDAVVMHEKMHHVWHMAFGEIGGRRKHLWRAAIEKLEQIPLSEGVDWSSAQRGSLVERAVETLTVDTLAPDRLSPAEREWCREVKLRAYRSNPKAVPALLVKAVRRKPAPGQGSLDFDEESHPREAKGAADSQYKPGEFVPREKGADQVPPEKRAPKGRTDTHRPVEMVPGEYHYLATSYPIEDEDGQKHVHWEGTDEWEDAGRPTHSTAAHSRPGQCDHCGAHHTYQTLLRHDPTGAIVSVGHQCYSKRFNVPGWENAVADKARRAELKVKQEANVTKALAEMTGDEREAFEWGAKDSQAHPIAQDLAHKAMQFGPLSEKQKALLTKVYRETQERVPLKELERENSTPVPVGNQTVTGIVLALKFVENDFGGSTKLLVQDERGFKVWGSRPGAFSRSDVAKGDRVRFTAMLERSKDDEFFGYFARPAKPEILHQAWWTPEVLAYHDGVKVSQTAASQASDQEAGIKPKEGAGKVVGQPFKQGDTIMALVRWPGEEMSAPWPLDWLSLEKGLRRARPAPGQLGLDFDAEEHPRAPAGSHQGGQFVSKEAVQAGGNLKEPLEHPGHTKAPLPKVQDDSEPNAPAAKPGVDEQGRPGVEPLMYSDAEKGMRLKHEYWLTHKLPVSWEDIEDARERVKAAWKSMAAGTTRNPVLGDRYVDEGIPLEVKGVNSDGDPVYGYEFTPEVFWQSDATGAMCRHYVRLKNGALVHPDELERARRDEKTGKVYIPPEEAFTATTEGSPKIKAESFGQAVRALLKRIGNKSGQDYKAALRKEWTVRTPDGRQSTMRGSQWRKAQQIQEHHKNKPLADYTFEEHAGEFWQDATGETMAPAPHWVRVSSPAEPPRWVPSLRGASVIGFRHLDAPKGMSAEKAREWLLADRDEPVTLTGADGRSITKPRQYWSYGFHKDFPNVSTLTFEEFANALPAHEVKHPGGALTKSTFTRRERGHIEELKKALWDGEEAINAV